MPLFIFPVNTRIFTSQHHLPSLLLLYTLFHHHSVFILSSLSKISPSAQSGDTGLPSTHIFNVLIGISNCSAISLTDRCRTDFADIQNKKMWR